MNTATKISRQAKADKISILNSEIDAIEKEIEALKDIKGIQLNFNNSSEVETWQTSKKDNTELVDKVAYRLKVTFEKTLKSKKQELKDTLRQLLTEIESEEGV